ncbi:unnamed protein product [Blepharisma stoltei]|uniref:Uncharacterized protein n=1 Tax=Blepharisma stoltei TaxID=1481888 RepID=A0AAU9J4V5_9CILI|nr:unnamed protein product [Blepharisma stoltei]
MRSAPLSNRKPYPRSSSALRQAHPSFHSRSSTPLGLRSSRLTERIQYSDYHEELQQSSAELKLLMEELTTLNEQKDVLQDIADQLKRELYLSSSYANKIKKNHDKLHNENAKIRKANEKIGEDRERIGREIRILDKEVRDIDNEVKEIYEKCTNIKLQMEAEDLAINGLLSVTKKMKKELSYQMKERDQFKIESNEAEKQIFQIENRIEKLRIENDGFLEKISKISRNV